MAATLAGRQLTEQHRQIQLAVRAAAARDILRLMAAYDLDDIDRSWLAIAPGMEAVVRDYHRRSAGLAAGYYQAFRTAEGAGGQLTLRLAEPPDPDYLAYSLGFYGQIAPKQMVQKGIRDVAAKTTTLVVGGATRHVLDGGRGTLTESVRGDRQALGYARVTAGKPCAFCAMLAGRGAVYKESTAKFEAHDHCACTVEPRYRRDAALPGRGDEFRDLYKQQAQGGSDPLNAFRRAYERPNLHVA